ncbi:MAG: DUF6265 family protein [Bacteroidota bacterium]
MAQKPFTDHTFQKSDSSAYQTATIADMDWMVGNWQGEGLGGKVHEVWSQPRAESMMGMFQMYQDDGVVFYELCQIVEKGNSLVLRIKHFSGDFVAWEEKTETVDFPLIKIENQTAWFEGLTYQRVGDELRAWVAFEEQSGKVEEGSFVFHLITADKAEKY